MAVVGRIEERFEGGMRDRWRVVTCHGQLLR